MKHIKQQFVKYCKKLLKLYYEMLFNHNQFIVLFCRSSFSFHNRFLYFKIYFFKIYIFINNTFTSWQFLFHNVTSHDSGV